MRTDFWPEEKVATLRRLVEEKLSAREISVAMGISRMSVLGKANRLKLQLAYESGGQRKPGAPPKPPTVVRTHEPMEALFEALVVEPTGPVAIWNLREHHCRAIVEGDPRDANAVRYCGDAALPNKSWCKTHAKAYLITAGASRELWLAQKAARSAGKES